MPSALVAAGLVIAPRCGRSPSLVANKLTTGARVWRLAVSLAAEAGGIVYLGQGQVLNSATGKTITYLWDVYPPASELAVGQGRIVVVTDPRVLDLYGLPA